MWGHSPKPPPSSAPHHVKSGFPSPRAEGQFNIEPLWFFPQTQIDSWLYAPSRTQRAKSRNWAPVAPVRIELAAIALAGLALYHGGGHEIVDVAVRGSGADYLVDAGRHLLEIAGRSRRSDFEA